MTACHQSPEALMKMAEAMLDERRLDGAREYFRQAQLCGAPPDRCAAGRWMLAMLHGDFAAGWRESDAIRRLGTPDQHRIWDGEDLAGRRVIVRCLHGLGDTVQFARYAGLLNRSAAKVLWEVPPAMVEMAACFRGIHHVVSWHDECKAGRNYDAQIEVMELPYIYRTTIADLPIATNYARLPSSIMKRAASEMGPWRKPRVGVVWNTGAWNESRSIPHTVLRRMLEVKDCEFWNLQGGPCRHVDAGPNTRLRDAPVCDDGILCLAGAIAQMDLVLSADTLAAHLAGSLGVPVWLLLQHAADWRWMVNRDDSPWYPSMRIFRQSFAGAWAEAASEVMVNLELWLESMVRRRA